MATKDKSMKAPNWDHLLRSSLLGNDDAEFTKKFFTFRQKGGDLFFRTWQKIFLLFIKIPSYDRFLKVSWTEIVDVIAAQISESHKVTREHPRKDPMLLPVGVDGSFKLNLKFSQQPCTVLTTKKRVAFAKKNCHPEDDILILGDDDYVSIYLARAGFKNITVLDIDENVLESIQLAAKAEGFQVETHLQDFSHPMPEGLQKDYKLAFMDPFYSQEGVQMFLGAASKLTEKSKDPLIFLSVHLLSLFQDGLKKVDKVFQKQGFKPQAFMRSFNTYPIPKSTARVLFVERSVLG